MHELSLVISLVEELKSVLQREGSSRVVSVELSVGVLSGVDPEALEFSFPLATNGTIVEGATLKITRVPVSVICSHCNVVSHPAYPGICCCECGSNDVVISSGQELKVRSLEVE